MTEFSFQNKMYDLLLNLEEDKIEKKNNLPVVTSIHDLRLLIDIIKQEYPLYADADNKTIGNFIKDLFKLNPLERYMTIANHTDENHYRPIECFEIKPGVICRMEGTQVHGDGRKSTYFYNHQFPTKELSTKDYAKEFDTIWQKAQVGKACILNTYKFKIGDIVAHIKDPNETGTILKRLPAKRSEDNKYEFIRNHYNVWWDNITATNEDNKILYESWSDEDSLILKQKLKLEASPMKTFNINKRKVTIQFEKYSPREWLNENIQKGYDKAVYLTLLKKNTEKKEFGWIEQQKVIEIGTNVVNTLNAIRNKLQHKYHIKLKDIKNLKIIDDVYISSKKKHGKKKRKVDTVSTPRSQTYERKLIFEEIREKQFDLKKESLQTYTSPHKLVCVKYIIPGNDGIQIVTRLPKPKADYLVKNKDNYEYATKLEWKKYLNTVKENKDKSKPGLTEIGKDHITGMPLKRYARRYEKHKQRKDSRLVKEQFIPVAVPEEEIEVNSIVPTIHTYDEDGNITGKERLHYKFIKPAHVILKRILRVFPTWKPAIITEQDLAERKARSEKDKALHYNKTNKKSLTELKEMFASDERRGNKFSKVEKWSTNFKRLVTLITTGNKYTDEERKVYINKKGLFFMVSNIINLDSKLHWDNIKIADFIRYIRLTTHGVFTNDKPAKIKKQKKQIEFEPIMFATKIDASKLKYNLPDQDKKVIVLFRDGVTETEGEGIFKENKVVHDSGDTICALNDILKWKYENDKEFSTIIIDEGGGFREIPIKFKRKKNEIKSKRIKKTNNNSEKSESRI
jgi:hypothetical protein